MQPLKFGKLEEVIPPISKGGLGVVPIIKFTKPGNRVAWTSLLSTKSRTLSLQRKRNRSSYVRIHLLDQLS